jgi:hypothetical protein
MTSEFVHPELLTVVTTIGDLDRHVPCDFLRWENATYRLNSKICRKISRADQFEVGLGGFVDSFNKTKSFVIDQSRGIRRSEILKMGERFRDGHVEAVDLFIASMMWGNGLTGYGRYRTCIALNIHRNGSSPIELLNLVGQDAARGHLEKAYKRLTNGLWWIGPAFATKFLYFASPPTSQALIFDGLVASWRGSELPWSIDKTTAWTWEWDTYQSYRKWCIRQFHLLTEAGHPRILGADPFGRPSGPDVVEAAIFAFQNQKSGSTKFKI